MAKVSGSDLRRYFERVRKYKAAVESLLSGEKKALALIKKKPGDAAFIRLAMVNDMLDLASNYIVMNGISLSVLKAKNEDALNDARKSLYKSVIYLEKTVGSALDASFSEYEENRKLIVSFDAKRRFDLVRKMGLALQLLENAYGNNTKWRWAFVELEGRYTAAAKNIFDLRSAVVNTDPRSPDYEPASLHLRLIKRLLMQAADRYRERYELSTERVDDFKMGIAFLSALRRLHALLGDRDESEKVQRKLDIWTAKLDTDIKKKHEAYLNKAGGMV